ncbi:MAG TPA: ferritin-like domain-containing protein [Marmoricola sp.]
MRPLAALQATLGGEHAAVWLYGLLGAQVSQSREPKLFDALSRAYDLHVRQRDELTVTISDLGASPVASRVSYAPPNPARTAAQQRAAALLVEQRLADLYGQQVESTTHAQRRWAIAALDGCAVRQLTFGGAPSDLPGMPVTPARPSSG